MYDDVYFNENESGTIYIGRGEDEPQYEVTPLYKVTRRDEPSQWFEDVGIPVMRGFSDAEDAANDDLLEIEAGVFTDGIDLPSVLSFNEWHRGRGDEWVAREFDTVGCDWLISLVGYEIDDMVNGGCEEVGDMDDVRSAIERDIDNGWF